MKRLLIILLMLMYGASSFGASLHFHFCCGQLKSIDFLPTEDARKCTGKTHEKGSMPCCTDKNINVKISAAQNRPTILYRSFEPVATMPLFQDYLAAVPFQSRNLLLKNFAVPPLQKNRNQLYCIYRI